MSIITTHHGEQKTVAPGSWVVYEYYKGFVNNVYVCSSHDQAVVQKRTLESSLSPTSPKHFSVRQIKD